MLGVGFWLRFECSWRQGGLNRLATDDSTETSARILWASSSRYAAIWLSRFHFANIVSEQVVFFSILTLFQNPIPKIEKEDISEAVNRLEKVAIDLRNAK